MAANAITDEATLAARPTWRQVAVEVLLIVAVFFVAAGDVPPHVNESHYLCRLKHFWNPSWCVGDLFLDSTDTQLVFIWLFGWVTRLVSLTATAWIGRVISWAALAWAWQRLSWRLVPRPYVAVLSAALFVGLNQYLHMAGEWVVGGVEAKCFAYALVLWALSELVVGRWNLAWVLLGAATAFHPLVGGWSTLVYAGVWLLDTPRTMSFVSMLPALIVGGLLGLVGVVPALMLTWNVPADVVGESSRIYVFDRLPHHLAPLSMPAAEMQRRLIGHAALVSVFVVLVVLLWRMRERDDASGSRLSISRESYRRVRRIELFGEGAVILALVGLAIEIVLMSDPLMAAKLLRYYWFRLSDFAMPMAVALQIAVLIAAAFERRRTWAVPALGAAIVLASIFPVAASWTRLQNPVPPSENKIVDYAAWRDACDWVADNAPTNALFLTPRLNLSFKWWTGRPEVVNRKDIPQDAAGIVEWQRRLKDIYTMRIGDEDISVDSVGALGTERVKELAKKYGAQFVLSDRTQLVELPVVYRNSDYVVYRVPN
jgi:hypothetical protein